MTTALANFDAPCPTAPRSNLFRRLPGLNRFAPVDDLRIQQEIEVNDRLEEKEIEEAIREWMRLYEDDYRTIGGSGLGYGDACISQDDALPARIRFSIFPLKAGENELMHRLAGIIDFRNQSDPSISRLPLIDSPEDRMDEEEFDRLLATAPRTVLKIA